MRVRNQNGFTLIELLTVVAIIGILAAVAVPGLLRARMSGNESSAIGSMRAISSAQVSYSAGAGQGNFAATLDILGDPCGGAGTHGFISPDLATNGVTRSGYVVTSVAHPTDSMAGPADCNGTPTVSAYYATALPLTVVTGSRGFATMAGGTIYFTANGTAPPADGTGTPLQ